MILVDTSIWIDHLHEPLVPGPCMWSGLIKSAPIVATFHAAGVSAAYRLAGFALKDGD